MNAAQYALFGSLGTGLLTLLGTMYQGRREDRKRKDENDQADKQREAKAKKLELRIEAEAAERAEQREAEKLTERRAQVDAWRDGLAASHEAYREWSARRAGGEETPPPNILTAGWFMALRPHLQRVNEGWLDDAIDDDDIQCDKDTANMLASEISRLEREWLGTGNYRPPGRPSRWERD